MNRAIAPPVVDLSECEREPIHAPGGVQPHAFFLAIDSQTGRPCAASRSFCELTGLSLSSIRADAQLSMFDRSSAEQIADMVAGGELTVTTPIRLADGRSLSGSPYRSEGLLMLDIEPCGDGDSADSALMLADGAMRAMRRAEGLNTLYGIMVDTVAEMTGFERVMLYQFDSDWNGEVVAESRSDAAPCSFKGLKFPASDIPPQARALFLRNRVRQIPEVTSEASPIEPPIHPWTGQPFDLSDSQVRAVSPVHVEYLSNMGVRASLVIALMRRSALWGLIACHHYSGPRFVPVRQRAACSLLCETFSTQLAERLDATHAAALAALDQTLTPLAQQAEVMAQASDGTDLEGFLASVGPTLLSTLQARSICVWMGDDEISIGEPLPTEERADLLARARSFSAPGRGGVLAVDRLPPLASGRSRVAAGFAYIAQPGGRDGTLALRAESVIPETWAGDPDKRVSAPNSIGRLHPRRSFDLWRSERRGYSAAWSETDRGALRVIADHLSHWRQLFEGARREALIRRIEAGRAEARRLALVAERASDTVIMTGADGRITWVNAAFERLTGYALDEVRDQKPGPLLQGLLTDGAEVERIGRSLARGEPVRSTLVNYGKDGSHYWVELEITPVFDDSGTLQQFIAIERDVTEARERETALEHALSRARESDRLKEQFLRVLSHEIRTPLNGVLGGVAVLTNGVTDERRLAMAREVRSAGQRLLSIFSEMLELARAEAEVADIVREPCAPRALLRAAAAATATEARRQGLSVRVEDGDGEVSIPLERQRIERILGHLLTNAIKFTPSGWIALRAVAPRRGGSLVRFEVEDSGPGVPPAMQARIFDPFTQVDGSESRRVGGLGLGLAVCRRLAVDMGAVLGVDTAPGGGALFWLEI